MAHGSGNNTVLSPFYYPWPNLGVKLSRQWGALRSNTEKEAPLIRAAYVDPQPVSANTPGEHDLSGWAIGERDFRNKFRIWYDKDNDRFSIQYNSGTEAVEIWNDYLSVRQVDGRVTIHGYGGLDATAGGFYTPMSRNLAKSGVFASSKEWQWQHDLNTKPILWDTFNLEDKSITPLTVDVSNPNIAYFYFAEAYAGRAIAVAEVARSDGIRLTDGTNNYTQTTIVSFNNSQFYLTHGLEGFPTVNLQPTATGGAHADLSGLTADDHTQYLLASAATSRALFATNWTDLTDTGGTSLHTHDHGAGLTGLSDDDHTIYSLADGTRAFTGVVSGVTPSVAANLATKGYVDTTNGTSFYGVYFRESDGNPPTIRNDTIIFDSTFFYLQTDSTGKPLLSIRMTPGGGGTGGSGVSAHSALTGLTADDHTQYSLADGTRAFTGVVSGITPTSSTHLTTKGYVDGAIGPGFYGIIVRESDGNPSPFRNDTLTFDSQFFYLTGSGAGNKPLVSLRANPANFLLNVVEDLSPQLGGDLDVNTFSIVGRPSLTVGGNAGDTNIKGGAAPGSGRGGNVVITGGTSVSGAPGSVNLVGNAGSVTLSATGGVSIDSSDLSMNNQKITDLAAPINDNDAVRYVDLLNVGAGNFYGVNFRESDGTPPALRNDTLIFDSDYFYLQANSVGKPIVSLRPPPSGATASHSTLSNLGADDHTQYSLITGTRPFTGTVGGITPAAAADLATKGYVDSVTGSSIVGPGFYGVYFRESDGNPPTIRNDTLIFDSTFFYLQTDSVGKPLLSIRMTPGGGGSGSGVSAHSALTGLTADDHTQYSLADGTRAFTGVVGGITPTGATHLTTKGYVDGAIGPGFYGIVWSDSRVTKKTDRLSFNGAQFYLDGSKPTVNLGDNQTFMTVGVNQYAQFPDAAQPTTPSAGNVRVYGSALASTAHSTVNMIDSDGNVINMVRDRILVVRNSTGSSIPVGSFVSVSGSTGSTPNIVLARADSRTTRSHGLTMEAIANNGFGRIMMDGLFTGIDLSAFAEGNLLYLSSSVAGASTTTEPTHPNLSQILGTVLRANANGIMTVQPSHGDGDDYGTLQTNYTIGAAAASSVILQPASTAQRTATFQDRSGTIAYTSDLGPGFYGIYFRESDGNPPTIRNDTVIFDSDYFYMQANSVGKPIISLRPPPSSGGSALTVQDIDGTPTVSNVTNIQFTNGSVTDSGGGVATVTITGGSGISTLTVGAQSFGSQSTLGFNKSDFYLSGGATSKVLNLRDDSQLYKGHQPGVIKENYWIEPDCSHTMTIDSADMDCRSGAMTVGFYIISAGNLASRGIPVLGMDPITVGATRTKSTATGQNTVNIGDRLVLSIYGSTSADHFVYTVRCRKSN